ncbi:VIT family-domain-containing protein [Hyaloraphidium curvatum]|nr:VIT family-domain-containing protein [Hyaloraphidium curvatum]
MSEQPEMASKEEAAASAEVAADGDAADPSPPPPAVLRSRPSAVPLPQDITLAPEAKAPDGGGILGIATLRKLRGLQPPHPAGDVEASRASPENPPASDAGSEVPIEDLPTEQYGHSHYSSRAPWLRACVLGANDGLVSTASLLMGVSGGADELQLMVLTGLSGMVAGALSMAAGEYVSVSSQKDAEVADLRRERAEFLKGPDHRRAELEELVAIYINRGLRPELARQVAEEIHAKSIDEIVEHHARDELGIDVGALSRPFQAAWTSALSFSVGAAIPLLAGSFIHNFLARLLTIIGVSSLALAFFGTMGAVLGGAPPLRAAIRVLLGGWLAMAVTYGVGRAFGVASRTKASDDDCDMARGNFFLLAAMFALSAVLTGAAASPVGAKTADQAPTAVLFRRGCGGCPASSFCEYAYPDAPANSVACVTYGSQGALYRRYAAPTFTQCGGANTGCGDGDPLSLGSADTLAACQAACGGAPSCLYVEYNGQSTCNGWSACSEPTTGIFKDGFTFYAKDPNSCPGAG